MSSRIRIQLGQIEVEYEGPEEFLKEELPDLLAAVARLHQQSAAASGITREAEGIGNSPDAPRSHQATIEGTTGTIAAKLQAKSGPDLALAAAAHIQLVQSRASFSRKELLEAMKSASGYYKDSDSSNLSKILERMIKAGDLLERSKDNYAISAVRLSALEASLAH